MVHAVGVLEGIAPSMPERWSRVEATVRFSPQSASTKSGQPQHLGNAPSREVVLRTPALEKSSRSLAVADTVDIPVTTTNYQCARWRPFLPHPPSRSFP